MAHTASTCAVFLRMGTLPPSLPPPPQVQGLRMMTHPWTRHAACTTTTGTPTSWTWPCKASSRSCWWGPQGRASPCTSRG